jgi:hypothetical protein
MDTGLVILPTLLARDPPHRAPAGLALTFDHLTQLPKYSGEASCEGELLFGGGVRGGRTALPEIGISDDNAVSDDNAYNMEISAGKDRETINQSEVRQKVASPFRDLSRFLARKQALKTKSVT